MNANISDPKPQVFANSEAYHAMVKAFRERFRTVVEANRQIRRDNQQAKADKNPEDFLHPYQRPRISALDFAFYALLRGKDWRSGLAPNTDVRIREEIHFTLSKRDPKLMTRLLNSFGITVDQLAILRQQEIPRWQA